MSDDPEPQVLEALREFNYRQLMPMTHEDYLNEPAPMAEWFMQFAQMD